MMENLERILRQHDFLKEVSPSEARFLVSCAKNTRFREGEYLLHEGAVADAFFLLRSGRVALEINVPGRGPVQMESLKAGDVLGLSWLSSPHRLTADARAVEAVTALAFDGACLRKKMEADPKLGFIITRRLLAETIKRLQRVRLQRLDLYGVGSRS
jgi:CRP/FNR family transcriptional regulator, cyclic AMP receptor protein